MDELEKKIPADAWQKLFDDAAEAPPPRVWDAIERRLDESATAKILPLWGLRLLSSRPLLWGTGLAAAVALLLVGWWVIYTPTIRQQSWLPHQSQTALTNVTPKVRTPASLPANALQNHVSPPVELATKSVMPLAKRGTMPTHDVSSLPQGSNSNRPLPQLTLAPVVKTPVSGNPPDLLPTDATSLVNSTTNLMNKSEFSHLQAASFVQGDRPSLAAHAADQVKFLTGRPIHLHEFGRIYRIVWFHPSEPTGQPESSKPKQTSRHLWASASVMPGAFDPMVSVQMASLTKASIINNTSIANTTYQAQSITSRANFSIAYQASAGMLLNERWSVETGIGYLAGNSTVDTPVKLATSMVANDNSKVSSNLYVDALGKRTTTSLDQANFSNNAYPSVQPAYSDQNRKVFTNNYQFIQVPVQVGYQLRTRKKLKLAVLGGIISNIFVRNTVDNEVVVTAKDGVYRTISFAAIMGARFRYQYSPQWSASLAGIYQPSIGLVTQANSQVQSQPTTAGMTLGVDYHF